MKCTCSDLSGNQSEEDGLEKPILKTTETAHEISKETCSDWLTNEQLGEQLAFWQEALAGAPALLDLPTDRPRPAVQSHAGSAIDVMLDADVTRGLHALARRHGATLFMVLQAGWSVLMGRLSGQDDVVIGTPVANRRRSELEGLVGFFVNTLGLRTRLEPQQTVAGLLQQVKDTTLAAYEHQDVPFEQVVEVVRPERSLSHSPVFQTMLVLQNAPDAELSLAGLTLSPEPLTHESTHFDLTLSLEETAEGLQGALAYSTALFDRETVARWLGHLKVLLGAMVADERKRPVIYILNAVWRTGDSGPLAQRRLTPCSPTPHCRPAAPAEALPASSRPKSLPSARHPANPSPALRSSITSTPARFTAGCASTVRRSALAWVRRSVTAVSSR